MARRFRGESQHKVDKKGRVSIPASFRRVLVQGDTDSDGENPNVVIVYGDHRRNYLECYTMAAMDEVDDMIARLPRGSKNRRMLERLFSGQSHQTQVDDTGRLVLPQKLREKIGIDDEAFFVATGDTFQIWNPAAYEEDARKTEEWLDDLPDDFDPLTLLDGASPEAAAETPGPDASAGDTGSE